MIRTNDRDRDAGKRRERDCGDRPGCGNREHDTAIKMAGERLYWWW